MQELINMKHKIKRHQLTNKKQKIYTHQLFFFKEAVDEYTSIDKAMQIKIDQLINNKHPIKIH